MKTKQPDTLTLPLAEITDEDKPVLDRIAPSLVGSLAPIMHPDSLARIEREYQEWLLLRKAQEAQS